MFSNSCGMRYVNCFIDVTFEHGQSLGFISGEKPNLSQYVTLQTGDNKV